MSTTLPQEWSTEVPVQEGATANVSPDGSHVFFIHEKDVMALDGTSGEEAWGEREGVFDKMFSLSNLSVNGTTLNTSAPQYQQLYVDYADVALLFDYSASEDVIRAIHPTTGEEQWARDDFQWSLAKYNSLFAQKIGSRIAQAISSETGGNTEVAPLDQRFVRDLALELPEREVFIFRTVDALVRLSVETGDIEWRISEFGGMGIGSYVNLPGGDVLVVSKAGESFVSSFSGDNHIARFDPETGDLRWIAEYGTGPGGMLANQTGQAQGTYVRGKTVLIDTFGRVQAYDLETGEELWHKNRKQPAATRPLVTAQAIYTTTYAGKAVQVGVPVSLVRYDLRSGEKEWRPEGTKTRFVSMTQVGDRIVTTASGDLFDGAGGLVAYDVETGEEAWRSAPFADTGMLSSATKATNLLIDGATVFAAGPQALHALTLDGGTPTFRVEQETAGVGSFDALLIQGGQIVAVGQNGVAFVEKTDGAVAEAIPTEEEVQGYFVVGDRLFLEHEQAVTVIDLQNARKMGVGGHEAPDRVYGDLGRGLYVTADGRYVFLLTGTTLGKYRVQ